MINLNFINFIKEHPNEELSREEYSKKIIRDYIVKREINRDKNLKYNTDLDSPTLDTSLNIGHNLPLEVIADYMSDSEAEAYEKLIHAIYDGKYIVVYNSLENSLVQSKIFSGDWSKLEPLTANIVTNESISKSKQLIFLSDKLGDGKFILSFPKLGHIGE